MNFIEKVKVSGHFEILKITKDTGRTEVLFEDSNSICSGLGQSIANMMVKDGCTTDPCAPESLISSDDATNFDNVRDMCMVSPYQIRYFQVGDGASGVSATSAVVSLGGPLTDKQWGGDLRNVDIVSAMLYANEDNIVDEQVFATINKQGTTTSSLVNLFVLDEETANGKVLDEAGLFVDNPYGFSAIDETTEFNVDPISVNVGGNTEQTIARPEAEERPGRLLAAYKQFEPIRKDAYFSLLFRWTINFSVNR